MSILIIDCGGTKTEWAFLGKQGERVAGITVGIHPFFLTEIELAEQFHKISKNLPTNALQQIFHYGTGTNSQENCNRLFRAYQRIFPATEIEIQTDLLGVARALCGDQSGIAIILGTGSHAGVYNGRKLIRTAGGLGYALGDEGSGAYLGKKLLNYYLNGLLPTELTNKLRLEQKLSREAITEAVYRKPNPNRFLASMAPFLSQHFHVPFIQEMVKDGFRAFFQMNLVPLQEGASHPLYLVGSIAHYFSSALYEIADEFDMEIGDIAKDPINGLADYHQE